MRDKGEIVQVSQMKSNIHRIIFQSELEIC